jgi:threonine dehydrogenase-like Zn-dependent dehydrogenase
MPKPGSAFNAFKIPDNISDDLASIFDPFGNAVHTALSFDLVGEDVLVSGAGPIGIMAAAVAKHVGARNVVITDVNEYRLSLARKMGVTRAVDVSKESLAFSSALTGLLSGLDGITSRICFHQRWHTSVCATAFQRSSDSISTVANSRLRCVSRKMA